MTEAMTVGELRESLESYYDEYASVLFKLDPDSEGDIGREPLLVRCIEAGDNDQMALEVGYHVEFGRNTVHIEGLLYASRSYADDAEVVAVYDGDYGEEVFEIIDVDLHGDLPDVYLIGI